MSRTAVSASVQSQALPRVSPTNWQDQHMDRRSQARFSFLIPFWALSLGSLRVARDPPGAIDITSHTAVSGQDGIKFPNRTLAGPLVRTA
jgi:hypothetical protein